MEYTGVITRIRYYSEETKFIVFSASVEEENQSVSMTGYMSYVSENDKYKFIGDYIIHPKYGKQFKIESYEVIPHNDEEEVIKYLSSSLFKGIGEKQATLIVQALGKDAVNLIKENKHVLDGVKGMSEKKRDTIYTVLASQDFDNEVLSFFLGHGISTRNLALIQGHYQEKTLEVLQNNPYQLIEDIDGIGFKTADDLALKIGFDPLDPSRLKSAILYCLKERCFQSGSTYQYYEHIYSSFHKMMRGIDNDEFNRLLNELIDEGKIILENECYYSEDLYLSEELISKSIQYYLNQPIHQKQYHNQIKDIENELSLQYDDKQKEAIESFMNHSFMILTGGPGTGKTTILQGLIKLYQSVYPNHTIALIAPTGRAAKRLSELTGLTAQTIHRLLKWDLHSNTFAINEENPLDYDLIVIDEFSMVDSLLFSNLLKASARVKKMLLVGDDHQLPSVAPGTLLKDLLQCDIPHIQLNHIYRQSTNSGIIQLAHHLRNDEYYPELFMNYDDIYFQSCRNVEMILQTKQLIEKLMEEGYDENDIQVLAPMYLGVAGIDAFNECLQELFNPADSQKHELNVGKRVFREGDKVLQLKNRVDDNVFNGDIGYIVEINYKDNFEYLNDTIIVEFDNHYIEYSKDEFNTLTHAYCISIHKAQGNEFPIVIMSVLNDYYIMLKKNLLYTAMTRAKRKLFILGDHNAFLRGINNKTDNNRLTSLKNKLNKKDISLYDFE
jgi:exodeoxyribonuclease V alpha subunit